MMGSRGNYALLACKECGHGKTKMTHSYGLYKVYMKDGNIKLRCRTCNDTRYFKTVQGGFVNDQDES
jgi:hypothetical protein